MGISSHYVSLSHFTLTHKIVFLGIYSDSVQLQRTVPHSITNWLTTVFCVSESEGIGFTKDTELTVFQSFFLEVLAPYSIRKGENFNLLVHVSNYANHSFPVCNLILCGWFRVFSG